MALMLVHLKLDDYIGSRSIIMFRVHYSLIYKASPTNTATSSVQLTVSSNDNGRMCRCIGHHTLWTPDKETGHTLDVSKLVLL
jgi:hypothetical protein